MVEKALTRIQETTLDVWRNHIGPNEPVALLDVPTYQNAGDTLIYQGELAYLKQLGATIRYRTDSARYDAAALARRHPSGTLLIRGGGNFGDRWKEMQEFREQIVRDFPDRRIVQLPQSMDFKDSANLTRVQALFSNHSDLVLMMRETPSYEKARVAFPRNEVVYCPDAAFGIGEQDGGDADVDVVKLLRRDSERRDIGLSQLHGLEFDWGIQGPRAFIWKAARIPQSIARRAPMLRDAMYPLLDVGYSAQASMNLAQALRVLRRGRVLVTDRLHAAVLGVLMGKPVIVADNDYGKVSAIYEDYLAQFPTVALVHSLEDARDRLVHLIP